MDTGDVVRNMTDMMMAADNEKDYATLREALNLIEGKGRHKISVPCKIGDMLYSVVGEKVNAYVVAGFRIDRQKIYMETEESAFLPADKVGIYYFFSQELAEREFNRKWRSKQ